MSFKEILDDIQGQRGTNIRTLKMDVELDKLERSGNEDLRKDILKALSEITYSDSVIHDALETQEIFVSQSAIRTWRIRNGIKDV